VEFFSEAFLGGEFFMSSMCFMCWGQVLRSSPLPIDDAYQGFPPLKIYRDGHLDIEFSPFLLADEIVMDLPSYERLISNPPHGVGTAVQSLKILRDEGFLQLRDFGKELAGWRPKIGSSSDQKLAEVESFLKPVRNAVKKWDEAGPLYAEAIGRKGDPKATLPVGIVACLAADKSSVRKHDEDSIRRILRKSGRFSLNEREVLTEVARPYIDHVHTGIALFRELKMPVMDWDDMGPMYQAIFSHSLESVELVEKHVPKLKQLFSVSLSEFEPSNVHEYLHARKDPRLEKFRAFIRESARDGKDFDPKLAQEMLVKLSDRDRRINKVGGMITGLGLAGSLLAAPIDLGLTAALATTAAVTGTQGLATLAVNAVSSKNIDWFLCLVDAKKATR
jgi:hypothetical protein